MKKIDTGFDSSNCSGPRGFGELEQGHLFQGNKEQRSKTGGNRKQSQFLWNREHRNQDFNFGEQGNKAICFRGTKGQVPPTWAFPASLLRNKVTDAVHILRSNNIFIPFSCLEKLGKTACFIWFYTFHKANMNVSSTCHVASLTDPVAVGHVRMKI